MPMVAVAASWLEGYKLPLREIRDRFTKSEMAVAGWRSSELAYRMKLSSNRPSRAAIPENTPAEDALEQRLGGLVDKAVREDGEVDLRNMTGQEVASYMGAFGFPIMPGISRSTG